MIINIGEPHVSSFWWMSYFAIKHQQDLVARSSEINKNSGNALSIWVHPTESRYARIMSKVTLGYSLYVTDFYNPLFEFSPLACTDIAWRSTCKIPVSTDQKSFVSWNGWRITLRKLCSSVFHSFVDPHEWRDCVAEISRVLGHRTSEKITDL